MGFLSSILGGGSSKTSTSATQTTNNNDNSLNAGDSSVLLAAGATLNVNDLSADVAKKALEIGADLQTSATNHAFDYLQESGAALLEFVTNASKEAQYEKIRNQDLTANLATQSFALADEKTQSSDDKVFNFGRTALLIGAGILALFFLIPAFKSDSKKQP
jgi:hypothetical protein